MDRKYSRLLCRAIPNSSITCPPSPAIMRLRRVRFSNGATNLYRVRLYTAQYVAAASEQICGTLDVCSSAIQRPHISRLQRIQKCQQRIVVGWTESPEAVTGVLGFPTMAWDRFLDGVRPSVMHETIPTRQSPQW